MVTRKLFSANRALKVAQWLSRKKQSNLRYSLEVQALDHLVSLTLICYQTHSRDLSNR